MDQSSIYENGILAKPVAQLLNQKGLQSFL